MVRLLLSFLPNQGTAIKTASMKIIVFTLPIVKPGGSQFVATCSILRVTIATVFKVSLDSREISWNFQKASLNSQEKSWLFKKVSLDCWEILNLSSIVLDMLRNLEIDLDCSHHVKYSWSQSWLISTYQELLISILIALNMSINLDRNLDCSPHVKKYWSSSQLLLTCWKILILILIALHVSRTFDHNLDCSPRIKNS
jgi:hypothetical protein